MEFLQIMEKDMADNLIKQCLDFVDSWKKQWPEFQVDSSLDVPAEEIRRVFEQLFDRLKKSYPFHYPGYAGQMLKPPHPVAILAYFAAMHINPNNHALDGGPATSELEIEAVSLLAGMFGFKKHLGHLTGGGTVANMEALWVSREIHHGRPVAFSKQAHYTHKRVCEILKIPYFMVDADQSGRMDLNHLESLIKKENVGAVVATVGTTSLGSLDPLSQIVQLKHRYGFRIHVDAAYGGFFKLLSVRIPAEVDPLPFQVINQCDSVVIDPHKHGLQPYGCGCVLFSDPSVGKIYKHDSPYTYFTSDKLHLGEISLECSRPGAAAAALWATLCCFPLEPERGMGPILSKCRAAAVLFARLIQQGSGFRTVLDPDLDIVAYFLAEDPRGSQISKSTNEIFKLVEQDKDFPVYLSKLQVDSSWLKKNFPELLQDEPTVAVLRSVFMKPEHFLYADKIYQTLLKASRQAAS